MDRDRRGFERIPLLGGLRGEVMVFQPITVQAIGLSGLTVETSFPLQLDSLHDVRLTLGHCSIVVKGRVVHSRIAYIDQDVPAYTTGLEFVNPSAGVTAAVAEFVATTRAQRAGS